MKLNLNLKLTRQSGFSVDVNIEAEADSIGLVGPSGSGKTTILNSIAGIEKSQKLEIDGIDFSRIPVYARKIGYVAQDSLLFPNLSVKENILYSPRSSDAERIISALGIQKLLDRMPRNLSGGEKKKVALARALASNPILLLLDEPFSGLDESSRREATSLLHEIKSEFKIPVIIVSHLIEDIVGLSTYSVRIENGRVVNSGLTVNVLRSVDTKIDNYFIGVVSGENKVMVGANELSTIMPAEYSRGQIIRLACYAHDIILAVDIPKGISARNCYWTEVESITNIGSTALINLKDEPSRVLVSKESVSTLGITKGKKIVSIIKATSIVCLGSKA